MTQLLPSQGDRQGGTVKIRLERDVLADAVAWAARSLPNRPSVPILAGLLIRADAKDVVLSSFDYETSAQISVRAEVADEGEVLVSGKLLADISRSLPNKPVDISADDSRMELVCGSARFTLQTLPVAEYPALPTMPESAGRIASADFAEAVSQVVVAAGRDELLPVFTGVRMEIDGDTISLLATDRYRMALKEITWQPDSHQAAGAALVPAKVLADTAKSMTSGEAVMVSLAGSGAGTDGIIGFSGSGTGGVRETTTRLLDGDFPKVRHLMNIQPALTVRADTAELIAAAKRVALVAERNTSLRMMIGDDSVVLEAATGDQAQASEAISAEVENLSGGEPPITAAGFNPAYLLDALTVLDAPFAHFSFTAPGKPCLITGLSELDGEQLLDYRHVIMLMRLPG
ncbi:MAG TPA: DNA polymerase III subunit beta [Propionibacterium sp.]|nr:DNA polymerase III subunit beta [Propionibacterium sp.]